MKTVSVNVYSFDELSDDAKKRALEDYRNSGDTYHWEYDALASIKKLAEHFGGRVSDYSLDWLDPYNSSMRFDMPEMSFTEIRSRLKRLGTYNRRTLKGNGDCVLTGYCGDENAIDGFRMAFIRGKQRDLNALMKAAYKTWMDAANQDAEWQFSNEGFTDFANGNDFQFTEDGKRW